MKFILLLVAVVFAGRQTNYLQPEWWQRGLIAFSGLAGIFAWLFYFQIPDHQLSSENPATARDYIAIGLAGFSLGMFSRIVTIPRGGQMGKTDEIIESEDIFPTQQPWFPLRGQCIAVLYWIICITFWMTN